MITPTLTEAQLAAVAKVAPEWFLAYPDWQGTIRGLWFRHVTGTGWQDMANRGFGGRSKLWERSKRLGADWQKIVAAIRAVAMARRTTAMLVSECNEALAAGTPTTDIEDMNSLRFVRRLSTNDEILVDPAGLVIVWSAAEQSYRLFMTRDMEE